MGLADYLRNILHSKTRVLRTDDGSLILREKDVMEIRVTKTPLTIVAINMGRLGCLSGVMDGEWTKRCDYMLVCEDGNGCVAIFIDLKKTIHGGGAPEEQLRWSLPIYRYLCAIYATHTGNEFKIARSEVRNYIIGEKFHERFDKQPVRPRPGVVEKKTYKGMEVNTYVGPQIPFNLLLRGATGT